EANRNCFCAEGPKSSESSRSASLSVSSRKARVPPVESLKMGHMLHVPVICLTDSSRVSQHNPDEASRQTDATWLRGSLLAIQASIAPLRLLPLGLRSPHIWPETRGWPAGLFIYKFFALHVNHRKSAVVP